MSQAREGGLGAGSGGSDQGTVRRANLALVLRSLRDSGPRSRARLAGDLGLNKATVSSLVGELIERGLVRDGSAERGAVGRPGTIVEINGAGAFGVGAEINVNHVTTLAVDLAGETVSERRTSVDTGGLRPDQVVDRLVELLDGTLADIAGLGAVPVSVVVGVAGLVDHDTGTVSIAPNLGWRGVPLAALLRERLRRPGLPRRGRQRGQPRRRCRGHAGRPGPTRHPRHPRRGRHRWRHRRRRQALPGPARLRRRVRSHARRPRRPPVRLWPHRLLGDRHRPEPPARAGRRRGRRPPVAGPRPRGEGRRAEPPRRSRRRAHAGRLEEVGTLGRHRAPLR